MILPILIATPILFCGLVLWTMRTTRKTRSSVQQSLHLKQRPHETAKPKRPQSLFKDLSKIVKVQTNEDCELLKEAIKIHTSFDTWENRRALWSKEPATEMQLAYLFDLGYAGPNNLNKREASELIDQYLIAREYNSMAKAMEKKKLQEAERQARKAQKRVVALERLNNTPPRARILQTTRIKWVHEFNSLWNKILADGSISIDEAEDLKAWLNSHRTINCMHEDFIAAIDRAVQDGVITGEESQALYRGAINLIENLGGNILET